MPSFIPFSEKKSEQIASISETTLIQQIQSWLGEVCPKFPHGIGDDCAVTPITQNSGYLLTTIDGIGWKKHFDENVTPENCGRKLLARNISDIASMGGTPKRAVISLWMSPETSIDWLEKFYLGLAATASAYEVEIIGGDVSSADKNTFIADLCLQGFTEKPVLRKQAQTGDTIWVTGTLGGSIFGKHFSFSPRVKEGKWLQERNWAKSMMDVSDGLAKDLPSLIGNRPIELKELPVSQDAKKHSKKSGKTESFHALNDGEDYELVFVVDSTKDPQQLTADWKRHFSTELTQIGVILAENKDGHFSARNQNGESLDLGVGYEHF